jgi:hypothetical protein
VSRERLQDAVFLAKRDLRRGVVVSTDGSNNEPSNEHVTDLRLNRREMEDGAVPVREQCVTEAVRRERKQPMNESEESLRRRNLADVTSWQVETKSVKDKRRGRQLLNAEEKQALEIFRLRKQLHEQLIKLKAIEPGRSSPFPRHQETSMSRRTLFDDHTDAIELKSTIKAEEHAARSARMIYVLQQQVHDIQNELRRQEAQPWKVSHTKKSRSMCRLAAAHRAAVRAIQTFVQTGELYAYSSLRGMKDELASLIHQLSQCCIDMNLGHPVAMTEIETILSSSSARKDDELGMEKESEREEQSTGQDKDRTEESDKSVRPKQLTSDKSARRGRVGGRDTKKSKQQVCFRSCQCKIYMYRVTLVHIQNFLNPLMSSCIRL